MIDVAIPLTITFFDRRKREARMDGDESTTLWAGEAEAGAEPGKEGRAKEMPRAESRGTGVRESWW